MAKIEVRDLKLNGAELFDDSEGFMDELSEEIIEGINGEGMLTPTIDTTVNPLPLPKPFPKPTPFPLPVPKTWTPVIL